MRYALVNGSGDVVNVVEWNGGAGWASPNGLTAVRDMLGNVGPGWKYVNSVFSPPSVPPGPTPALPAISDRQFFQTLALQGLITEQEALDAVRTGAIPSALQALVNQLAPDRFAAEMLLSGAVEFRRDHPLTALLGLGLGWTSGQLDDLWRAAAQL